MLDDFKKHLLIDLLRGEMKNIESGDTSYGDAGDDFDAVTALSEMVSELETNGRLAGESDNKISFGDTSREDRRPRNVSVKNTGSATSTDGGVANTGVIIN